MPMPENFTAPWTRGIVVNYRPELRFYEMKTALLRAFDDAQILHAFQVSEERTSALLGDSHGELVVTPNFLLLNVGPSGVEDEWELLLSALQDAMDTLQPTVVDLTFLSQHLLPMLETDYDSARHEALRRLLGEWPNTHGLTDFALLVDGAHDGHSYQAEFGVLDAASVPDRLGRLVGRINTPTGPGPIWNLKKQSVPPVAFFIDISWSGWPMPDEPAMDFGWISDTWDASAHTAEGLALALYNQVIRGTGNDDVKAMG